MPPRGSRARGRGGGRTPAHHEQDTVDHVLDPIHHQLPDIPVNSSNLNTSSSVAHEPPNSVKATEISDGPSSTSGPRPVAPKFKPRMVKRVAKVEPDAEVEEPDGNNNLSGRGRGRGRGRGDSTRGGRGRPEIVMTASGAFAMGPAEASSRPGIMAQGPSRSGMRKIDNTIAPTEERSRTGTARTGSGVSTPWDGGPSGMFELYSDIDENGSEGEENMINEANRARVADLNDITLEHSMAPLSLPWDPKRIADREKMIQERQQKMLRLANLKIKKERQEAEAKPFSELNSTSSTMNSPSVAPTRESTTTTTSVLKDEELDDAEDVHKREVKLKKEQLEELSKVGKQFLRQNEAATTPTSGSDPAQAHRVQEAGPGPSSLFVFQFPRNFPKFRDPKTSPAQETAEQGVEVDKKPLPRKIIKKKKPGLDDWMGWGKGGRRTECMGVPIGEEDDHSIEGQMGELVIRRSGRVQMIIADVAYDVLPGAQPTFHQEIAAIDPKPQSNLRAMFVLGSTNDKFIVVPNVTNLLKREQALNQAESEKPK